MADIPKWQNIPVAGPVIGYQAVPENIPHYYDADLPSAEYPGLFTLQVVAVGYDSAGNIPDDPPEQYRSPLYHRAKPYTPPETGYQPRAAFDGGFCSAEGWAAPKTVWMRSEGPGSRIPMSTDDWAWVNFGTGPGTPGNGTIGTPPGGYPTPGIQAYIAQAIAAVDALKAATQKK